MQQGKQDRNTTYKQTSQNGTGLPLMPNVKLSTPNGLDTKRNGELYGNKRGRAYTR